MAERSALLSNERRKKVRRLPEKRLSVDERSFIIKLIILITIISYGSAFVRYLLEIFHGPKI